MEEQLKGMHSLLPACGYQGSNSDPYGWLDSKHPYPLSYLILEILGVVLEGFLEEMTNKQVLRTFYLYI